MNLDLGRHMESEISEQADLLANVDYAAQLGGRLTGKSFDMVVLVARGSSDNAATFARYLIEIFLGLPVSLAAPSVLTRYHANVRYPKCLTIGISQSGAAPDVSEVVGSMRSKGHMTLGITNTAGSRLTAEAEASILLNVGIERSVAATKTYSASLAALYAVAQALGADLPKFSAPTAEWIEASKHAAMRAAGHVVRSTPVFVLARGLGYCTALETGLKLMECALIPGTPFSAADFEHGPKALAGPTSAAICYNAAMSDLAAQGCTLIDAPEPPVAEPLHPVWDIAFGQWLALHAARARSLDPDVPRNLRKVTETL